MKALFVTFDTSLSAAKLAACRRKLIGLLGQHDIDVQTLTVGKDLKATLIRLVMDAKATPVVAIDDAHPLPNDAGWLADLTANVLDLTPIRRPQLVYVTRRASAEGTLQALRHPVVRHYIDRDTKGKWVDNVAKAVVDLADEINSAVLPPIPTPTPDSTHIVGISRCFCSAIEDLQQIIEAPYGLVTGESGVGKLFLIRRLWQATAGKKPLVVVPCGSFFKDYYVAGQRRRFGGGREAVDQLSRYFLDANHGMLVLHHIEQIPSALQEELAVRLTDSSGEPDGPMRMSIIDTKGVHPCEVRVLATSTFPPEQLRQTGRLIPELAVKLRKRHVRIPTLRERGSDDLQLLCDDVVQRITVRQGTGTVPSLADEVVSKLAAAEWPENLSDLVRVLEYAVRHSHGGIIRPSHLPKDFGDGHRSARLPTLDEITAQAQRTAIENALEQTGGSVAKAAELLGRNKGALHRLMKTLGMGVQRSKRKPHS